MPPWTFFLGNILWELLDAIHPAWLYYLLEVKLDKFDPITGCVVPILRETGACISITFAKNIAVSPIPAEISAFIVCNLLDDSKLIIFSWEPAFFYSV